MWGAVPWLQVYGVEVVLTGDALLPGENSLMVVNHPTRLDWNFLWMGLFHAGPTHNAKIILKESVRKVPGLGWVMAMSRFVYLKRVWSEDREQLDRMLDYFSATRTEGARQLLLFPEGTNITPTSIEKAADKYSSG